MLSLNNDSVNATISKAETEQHIHNHYTITDFKKTASMVRTIIYDIVTFIYTSKFDECS